MSPSSKARCLPGAGPSTDTPSLPASEIAEYAALLIPEVGGTFLQAESEVSAINMVYGAASAGQRVMTASSGPGLSLMQEGISYIAGSELPCVIVDVVRGGPGLGNIAPEQSDYFCCVKGGGHGCYRNIVLAPGSVQEMFDLTVLAFELADRYRNPVIIMTDGYVGQMQEPLDIKLRDIEPPAKDWAVKGTKETQKNVITSIFLEPDDLEAHVRKLESQISTGPGARDPQRKLPDRRRRHSADRFRHRFAGVALDHRPVARPGRESRTVPADYAVAVPVARAAGDGEDREVGDGGGAEHRHDGGRRQADAEWLAAHRVLRTRRRQRAHRGRDYRAGVRAHRGAGVSCRSWRRVELAFRPACAEQL